MTTKATFERLGRRVGIRLVDCSRLPPPAPKLYAYRFDFPALMIKNRKAQRCYPGARWYGSNFGADTHEEAWEQALTQFVMAIDPRETRFGRGVR